MIKNLTVFIIVGLAAFLLGISIKRDSQQVTTAAPVQQQLEIPSVHIDPIQIEIKQPDIPQEPQIIYVQPPVVTQQSTQIVESTPQPTEIINKPLFKVLTPVSAPTQRPSRETSQAPSSTGSNVQPSTPIAATPTGATNTIRNANNNSIDPCAIKLCVPIFIDYSGLQNKPPTMSKCLSAQGATAWSCIQAAGLILTYKDYGGSLGIFVSAINGVEANYSKCNCFWEFEVNGNSSDVGVSSYKLKQGDQIGFRISK